MRLLHQHPGGVTAAEVAAHLGVTIRSARRYLEEVRTDLEAGSTEDGGKRWRIPAIDLPRRLSVRRTQAYALLAARPLFEALRGSAIHQELDLAAEELVGVARRAGRGPNAGVSDARLEQRFRYVPFAPIDYGPRSAELDDLFHAVADLRPIACQFPGETGALERLVLHPYALVLFKEAIYVVARDEGRGTVRVLELDHVRETRVSPSGRFELPDDFSLEDYVQGQFGLWRAEGPLTSVVIDFDARVAAALTRRRFHPSQRLEPLADGTLRMHLALGDLREVAPWVLGFGALATVREPPSLRDAVRGALADAIARYDAPSSAPAVTAPKARATRTLRAARGRCGSGGSS